MGQIDTERIRTAEEETTFTDSTMAGLVKEIDGRVNAANCFPVITRTSGLISRIDYYSDIAHTQLRIRRDFTRTVGTDQVAYVTGIVTTFYNSDGSVDSTVTTAIARDASNYVTECDNVFSTGESIC